jgi:DNA repair protein RadC
VIEVITVARGSLNSAHIRLADMFREAVRRNAAGLVMCHVHPSGQADPPSPDDLHLTAEALHAGRILGVDVLDHIIVARDGWVSLRDRGVAFARVIRNPA